MARRPSAVEAITFVEERENQFWLKVGNGPWLIGEITDSRLAGKWTWVTSLKSAIKGDKQPASFHLQERGNNLWIAPRSANFKVDRIVLYQSDREKRAFDVSTPVSDHHPWARP